MQGIVTGLQPSTKYYLRMVARNEHGTSYSTITEFTTIAPAPLVRILETLDVTETTATLYGQVNPNSLPTSFYFEYGPTPALGMTTPVYTAGDTTEFVDVSAGVTGLTPRTTYYYRMVAVNGHATATTGSVRFFTAAKPVVSAFTPMAAPIGTTVTITGRNFSTTPGNTQVNFGATRAEILTASATQLEVKVPAGASLGPIAVLDLQSGLATESVREFVPTYTGSFSTGNLKLAVGFNDLSMYRPIVQDLDGDHRPDIIGGTSQGFRIYQNVHQGGDITAASFLRTKTTVSDFTSIYLYAADLDGNGLADIVGEYQTGLRIYPNRSVPGYIFLGEPLDVPIGNFYRLALRDFDGDGRIDIAYTHYTAGSYRLTVLRNQNPAGSLTADNFRPQYSMPLPYEPYSIVTPDLNNDGNPDLVFGTTDQSVLWMLRNDSRPGTLAFSQIITTDPARGRFARYTAGDLNADGWKDVVLYTPGLEGKVAVWENNGTSPQITLTTPVPLLDHYTEDDVQPGDLDGDGKPDLLVGTEQRELRLLRNKSAAGSAFSDASFEQLNPWGTAVGESKSVEQRLAVNDLNGDGRPEVINSLAYYYGPRDGYIFEIWQNDPDPCLDPTLVKMEVTNTTAKILLPANTTFDQYEIEYRTGNYDWSTVSSNTINYLTPGYPYQFRVRAKCGAGFTAYHAINFTTDCVDPNNVTLGTVSANYVTLNAPDINKYEIQYSPAGKNEWTTHESYSYTIYSLAPGTTYDLRIRGRCVVPSPYRSLQFTTVCPSLSSLAISEITYNSAIVIGINYAVDVTLEYSRDNISWTRVGTNRFLYPLVPGTRYFVRGKIDCANTAPDFTIREFTTPCPTVSFLTTDAVTPTGARISWYDESNTDGYRVRYTLPTGGIATVETSDRYFVLDGFAPGSEITAEVAPRCVGEPAYTRTTFVTDCYTPQDLIAGNVTHTTARLTWSAAFSASPFVVDYAVRGTNTWQTLQTADTQLTLTGLQPGTGYEVRVRIICQDRTADRARVYLQTPLYEKTVYFPNPTDGTVVIHPSRDLIGHPFVLCDNLGRTIASGLLAAYTVDLSPYPPGIYLLKIEGEDLMKITKR
ncbi:FG-GAP-like repeat-containing protein [Dawidia soli]|uniref:VCBS repeat-containing protein n=1 Tax=Dawidia soli TaxID=2782352 RepID=A0AAP2DF31_9BACT|nr:FG-GAP-like repeat-containing protein [Dawidia soli]MBT1690828.1 VCBS repeat-containing protein [Dawidia soli]